MQYEPNHTEEQDVEEKVTVRVCRPEVRDDQKLHKSSDEDEEFKWQIPRRWFVY